MKRIISVFLATLMLFAVMSPVVNAAAAESQATPIVYLRGNGEKLFNADGEEVAADIGDLKISDDGEDAKNKIVEAAVNILIPFLGEGLMNNEWDNYARAIYNEISPLFDDAILDGNGNPRNGTGVHPDALKNSEANAEKNLIRNGQYGYFAYMFCFDWRLDPYEHVDRLHSYIETVMKSTGKKQISLSSRCLGGSLLNAYLEKYGHLGHIKNVMYCETLSDGCNVISKGFSGQINIDAKSLQRYEGQFTYCDKIGFGIGFEVTEIVDEIIISTLDVLTQTGVMDTFTGKVEELYAKLYKALIPAIFHSIGYASQPIYWTLVEEEDFDLALEVMFGEEGSETRTYFAGLIEKIQNYREKVTSQREELYEKFSKEYGIHIGVIAKYGFLNAPFTEGYDDLSDSLVSLKDSSLGATCAKIGSTLDEEYIERRVLEGKGKYISPDKQVDTSTCMFPDTTWIIKNVHHDDFDPICRVLAEEFLNGTEVTVENSSFARFRINDYDAMTVEDMTEENCADLEFINRAEEKPDLMTKLASLMRFITMFFKVITMLIRGSFVL